MPRWALFRFKTVAVATPMLTPRPALTPAPRFTDAATASYRRAPDSELSLSPRPPPRQTAAAVPDPELSLPPQPMPQPRRTAAGSVQIGRCRRTVADSVIGRTDADSCCRAPPVAGAAGPEPVPVSAARRPLPLPLPSLLPHPLRLPAPLPAVTAAGANAGPALQHGFLSLKVADVGRSALPKNPRIGSRKIGCNSHSASR
jgi:hypothetical protein